MGQGESRGADHSGAADADGPSLWEGVPKPILWLVQSQVKQLLASHSSSLLLRPEILDAPSEAAKDAARRGALGPEETALARSALRDSALAPRLQKVLDNLVPAHLSESVFWDNFFSHVDVIKLRVVTDYLTAQDKASTDRKKKHEEWLRLFDAMDPEMRENLRSAAERIAARQQPPPPSTVELQMGLDGQRAPRWKPDGDAWLEYVEDGPWDITKVHQTPRLPTPICSVARIRSPGGVLPCHRRASLTTGT
jgi:hypothetical protein